MFEATVTNRSLLSRDISQWVQDNVAHVHVSATAAFRNHLVLIDGDPLH